MLDDVVVVVVVEHVLVLVHIRLLFGRESVATRARVEEEETW